MRHDLTKDECETILKRNYIGHLGYLYRDRPFVVPITYFFNGTHVICYSGEGHKLQAMRQHAEVTLEVSEIDSVNDWKSVALHGSYEESSGSEGIAYLHEFSLGVKDIILTKDKRSLDFIHEFSAKIESENIPVVFRIKAEEYTGKSRF